MFVHKLNNICFAFARIITQLNEIKLNNLTNNFKHNINMKILNFH